MTSAYSEASIGKIFRTSILWLSTSNCPSRRSDHVEITELRILDHELRDDSTLSLYSTTFPSKSTTSAVACEYPPGQSTKCHLAPKPRSRASIRIAPRDSAEATSQSPPSNNPLSCSNWIKSRVLAQSFSTQSVRTSSDAKEKAQTRERRRIDSRCFKGVLFRRRQA